MTEQSTTTASGPGARPRPHGGQLAVPCWFMRGGTSRGPFFRAADLPSDRAARDAVLLAALGSPDPRQIDGLGGAHPLTSKAGIVGPSEREDVDLEFRFAQLQPDSDTVDTTPNCGNMLAAVLPFAVESGLLEPAGDTTTARVLTLNTGLVAEITVRTPEGDAGRYVEYDGGTRIDGVPGTAAPVSIGFLDTAGSVCSALLPTGNVRDRVDVPGTGPLDVTCIDNGQPLVIVAAADLGRTGYESAAELNADDALKARVEALRLACGQLMGLGDVTGRNYPKMTLVAPPAHGGTISTRSFIPHVCHASIGVLAAVTAATACVLDGSVAHDLAALPAGGPAGPAGPDGPGGGVGGGHDRAARDGDHGPAAPAEADAPAAKVAAADAEAHAQAHAQAHAVTVSVEHPSGEFGVELGLDPADPQRVTRSALLRTARLIMAGDVLVPRSLGDRAVPPGAAPQHETPQHETAQHETAQHEAAQHGTPQHQKEQRP